LERQWREIEAREAALKAVQERNAAAQRRLEHFQVKLGISVLQEMGFFTCEVFLVFLK